MTITHNNRGMVPSGVTRSSNHPAFSAMQSNSVNQNNIVQTTWTKIKFDLALFDQNDDFNTSDSTFTAPVSGVYALYAGVTVSDLNSSGNMYLAIRVAGREYRNTVVATKNTQHLSVSLPVLLDAGDRAAVYLYSNGNRPDVESHSNPIKIDTIFSGYLAC